MWPANYWILQKNLTHPFIKTYAWLKPSLMLRVIVQSIELWNQTSLVWLLLLFYI